MDKEDKYKEISEKYEAARNDPRFIKTMSFLLDKKVLFSTQKFPEIDSLEKISTKDVLWAGKWQPRIWEILPATMILHKDLFIRDEDPKENLDLIIDTILKNKENGPDFKIFKYKKYKIWHDRFSKLFK